MSTLSIKLKQRARVLAAGAAITAITLAMLPGVAEAAKKDSVGADVGSTVGGSVGSAAPANSGGSEPISTDTDATSVNEVGTEGANGDAVLTSSSDAAPVPASIEATGDAAVESPAGNQTIEACGDLNADACPQAPADSADPADGGGTTSEGEPITSATDLTAVQQLGEDGVNGDTALTSDNTAPVSASVEATGEVAVESPAGNQNLEACGTLNAEACTQEAPADGTSPNSGASPISTDNDLTGEQNLTGEDGANGDTALTNNNTVPAPVTGVVTADAEANTPVADQTGELCVTVNSQSCEQQPAGGAGTTPNGNGVIAVDSINEVGQQLTDDGLGSALDSTTDVEVPALPASGVVNGNGNVAIPGVANEDLDLCATLNRDGCAETPVPGGNAPGGGAGAGPGNNDLIDVDSSTIINEALANGGLNGDTSNNTVINAPVVPASGSVVVDGNAAVGEIVNQNAGICLLLNRAGCGAATTPPAGGNAGGGTPPNSGGNPITSVTDIIGKQNAGPGGSTGTTLINSVTTAPVPASVLVTANGNAAVDGVLNQGIGACLAVNANCGQAAAPGNNAPGDNASGGNSDGTIPGSNAGDNASGGTGDTNPDGTSPDGNAGGTSLGDGASADPGGDDGAASSGGNSGVSPNGSAGANSGDSVATPGNNASGTAAGGSANSTPLGSTNSGSNAAGTTLGGTALSSMALGGGANRSALALAQPSAGGSSAADGGSQASASGGSQASASGGSQASASSESQEASTSLPSTGGVSPLLTIMMLIFIGAGIFLLATTTRRIRRLNS